MNACEDFFNIATKAHTLSVIMTEFGMSSLKDTPSDTHFSESTKAADSVERRSSFIMAIQIVLNRFVDISFGT